MGSETVRLAGGCVGAESGHGGRHVVGELHLLHGSLLLVDVDSGGGGGGKSIGSLYCVRVSYGRFRCCCGRHGSKRR